MEPMRALRILCRKASAADREEHGSVRTYDSGGHQINGVSQQQSHGQSLAFTSETGVVDLDELKQVS
jgi:hypothetical protein